MDRIDKFLDELEETFAHIREREGGDSVCGLCEYDGAYIGESGDWCNECPGFNKDDCFKLRAEIRKKWKAQLSQEGTEERTESHACDLISRQAAVELAMKYCPDDDGAVQCDGDIRGLLDELENLPPAQPEIIHCGECIYYDPPHVEKEDTRHEYSEMPKEAFDVLGTGLVSVEYGINIGGRCCVDYYCKNYSDDKRVYVRKDNYCGRAERRTDE